MSQPVLVVAPYLPIREPVEVGPWRLLPVDDVDDTRVSSDVPLPELLKAYDVPGSGSGAVAHLAGENIGAPVSDTASIECLHWALLYDTLAASLPRKGEGPPKTTADNALLWAHPFKDRSFTAFIEGGLSSVIRSISLTDSEIEQIPKPEGLTVIRGSLLDIDDERMTALYEEMAKGLILGRRLQRTLEWLNFAWTTRPRSRKTHESWPCGPPTRRC